MKKLIGVIACIMLLGLSSVFAQSKQVTGTITDMSGLGLPGVSVSIKGTTDGTNTDIDGKWALDAKSTDVLIVSFVGMKTQEIKVGDKTFFKVILEDDRVNIEEVMVVAYGTAKKKSFTGSATQVSGEKIAEKNVSEISKALSGEVAGVQVVATSGQPGSNAKIRIRGFGSVNASQTPLYIVDGVPYNGDLSSISPSDIAATSVLKDASATAIYGARGSNGVIMITTKKGKKGHSSIEAEYKFGVNMRVLPLYDVIDNPERFIELTHEGLVNKKGDMASANAALFGVGGIAPYYNLWNKDGAELIGANGKFNPQAARRYNPTKWEDEIFRTGMKHEASVRLMGGSEKTTYFSSIGMLKEEGYYIGSDFTRLNTRLNINHEVKRWLKGSANMSYAYMESNSPGQSDSANNGFSFVNNIPSIYDVYLRDAAGKVMVDPRFNDSMYDFAFDKVHKRPFAGGINPAGAIKYDKDRTYTHDFSFNTRLDATITKDISFNTTFGVQTYIANNSTLTNPFFGDAMGTGRVYKDNQVSVSYTWNQLLTYNHTFSDVHHVDAFIAHEVSSYEAKLMYGGKDKIVRSDLMEWNNAIIMSYMNSYVNDYSLESYFAQAKYDYDNKYFIHGTIRRDGTSRFPNDKWGTFGSVGLAWLVTSEDFMNSVNWVKDLKVKASYGVIGNQALMSGASQNYYPTYDTYSVKNLNDEISLKYKTKANSDLTWERSNSVNFGIETTLFDFVDVEMEYFRKTTDQLLFTKRVAPSLGYATLNVNDGELLNSGFEFNTNWHIIKNDNLNFNIRLNGSHYANEISVMPIDNSTGKEKALDIQGIYAYSSGHSMYDFYMRDYAGVNPTDGKANWVQKYYVDKGGKEVNITSLAEFKSNNPDTKILERKTDKYEDATLMYVDKSVIPVVSGGIGLDFGYKGFSLSANFTYSLGGYAYDAIYKGLMEDALPGSNNWSKDIEKRWQKPGDITDVPKLTAGENSKANGTSTRFLTKSDYLSLNNVRLGYTFNKGFLKKIKIENASLFVSADNLMVLSKRTGFFPNMSLSGASDAYGYAPLTSVTMGIKLKF